MRRHGGSFNACKDCDGPVQIDVANQPGAQATG
jgi:hypothetical protein